MPETYADWFDDEPRIDEIDGDWTDDEIRRYEREYAQMHQEADQ